MKPNFKLHVVIDPASAADLMSHNRNDLIISPFNLAENEYVMRSPSGLEKRAIEKLHDLFSVA